MIAAGAARVSVPAQPLGELATGAAVDLFIRPEHLRPAQPADAGHCRGDGGRAWSIRAAMWISIWTLPQIAVVAHPHAGDRTDASAGRGADRGRTAARKLAIAHRRATMLVRMFRKTGAMTGRDQKLGACDGARARAS